MSAAERVADLSMLIEGALREQQDLTAVERFSQRHEAGLCVLDAPRYEDLIPLGRAPAEGQQLAFRVDLDRCTGCKACVTACHNLNGLAEGETWRDVGLVIGDGVGGPIQQTVTSACHHCEDPACLSGCPVQAYEKDPVTGIVRHLDDQCIGCQYCVLMCPYDVPKFDSTRGIVRKCDMCADRLAEDEAPACVQGCPTAAISIEIVDIAAPPGAAGLIPGMVDTLPPSAHTRPTTRYVSERDLGAPRPAADARLRPGSAHDPLAVMLVLTQLSIGVVAIDGLLAPAAVDAARAVRLTGAGLAALLGLAAATFHLGRPLYAFRAMLGWRTSWMSREILAFGAYVPAVLCLAAAAVAASWGRGVVSDAAAVWLPVLQAVAVATGAVGLLCSVMIYVDTRRVSWSIWRTAPGFAGTTFILGALACGATGSGSTWLLAFGAFGLAFVLHTDLHFVRSAPSAARTDLERTARLLASVLAGRFRLRMLAGAAAVVLAVLAASLSGVSAQAASVVAVLALVAGFVSELVGRQLFFTAEAARAMPGS